MWIAAAFVTTLSFGANNTLFKWSTGNGLSKIHIQLVFYVVAFSLTLVYGVGEDHFHINTLSLLLGGIIGVLNANGNIQMTKAFEKGPASLTSPLIGSNAIFPILSAALIFHEHISMIQWVGIVFIMGSAIVIQYSPHSKTPLEYRPWLLRVFFSIVSFGLLGILMKTASYLHFETLDILVCMYGGGSAYLAINSLLKKEKWKRPEVKVGAMAGLVSIIGYSSYFYALLKGSASIVFPIVSLNCLIVVVAGCFLFKESLKKYQIAGIISAALGIIFTKI